MNRASSVFSAFVWLFLVGHCVLECGHVSAYLDGRGIAHHHSDCGVPAGSDSDEDSVRCELEAIQPREVKSELASNWLDSLDPATWLIAPFQGARILATSIPSASYPDFPVTDVNFFRMLILAVPNAPPSLLR